MDTSDDDRRKEHPPVAVYLRERWTDDWELREYLRCDVIEFAANPSTGLAELEWRYGRGQQADRQEFTGYSKLDVLDWFVKVVVDPDQEYGTANIPPWYGIIVEERRDLRGTLSAEAGYATSSTPTGVQRFVCWGLIHALDQTPILQSMIEPSGSADLIGRAVAFNLGKGAEDAGHHAQPNASTDFGPLATRVFARDLADADEWTAYMAIQYIIKHFQPVTSTGEPLFDTQLSLFGPVKHLFGDRPRLAYEGQTIKAVLDALMDRRRLAGYGVIVDETTNKLWVEPFTYCSATIELPSGVEVEANDEQVSLDFDRDVWVQQCELRVSAVTQYDQVAVIGARRGSVFTISALDETLVKHWTSSQQTAYNTAASGAGDYSGLPDHEKQRRNDVFRQAEALRRVYCYFGLPEDWDGMAKDGEEGTATAVMPQLDGDLEPDTDNSDPFWLAGLRFERVLPLLTDHDYTSDVTDPTDNTPDGQQPEQLPMLVMLKLDNEDEEDETHRYGLIDRLASEGMAGIGVNRPAWSASVLVQQQSPGLIVRVHAGQDRAVQHKIAASDFTAADTADEVENEPDLDWRDNLLATVYVLNDSRLMVLEPPTEALEVDKPIRRLVVNAKDAHLDWVAPGTVVGLQDGELQRTTSGGFVRDDRERVKDLAKLAAAWYLAPRNCITLTRKGIRRLVDVGQLVTTIGASGETVTVDTVVTRVRYDLLAGTTTIETQAGELDLSNV